MAIDVFPPGPALEHHVQLFTVLELDAQAPPEPPQRIVPDGIVEIVFHYGAPFAMRHAGEGFVVQPTSFAISQTHRFVEIRPTGSSGFVSARLYPWAASALFATPVSEFSDRLIPAEELWEGDAARLEERLACGRDPSDRVCLLRRFLRAKFRADRDEPVRGWVQSIWRRRGDVAISGLCDELGVGERRLERSFRTNLGTSPKHFARITRFLYACKALRTENRTTLAEAAQSCGYADQAHFNRNFKAFSGVTPRQFLENDRIAFMEL